MRLSRWMTLVCGLLTAVPASAQHFGGRCQQAPSCCPCTPSTTTAPGEQPKVDQPPMVEPSFAPEQATAGGTEGYAMNMIGDFIAPGQRFSFTVLPLASHSLKVAVNQNVVPQDRVYLNYNFYDELITLPDTAGVVVGNDAWTTVFGIEKTFLDGNVSLGARLPINSLDGEFVGTSFGDLSLILKVLLVNNCNCAVSAGIGLSTTTGPDVFAGVLDNNDVNHADDFHTWTFQPYVAGLHVNGSFFTQAWTALAIPFDSEVPTIWFTDVVAGYFLYRKGCGGCNSCGGCGCGLSALAGILELHVNIPLEHDTVLDEPIGISDWIVLVEGVTAQFGRSTLTLGLGQPLTGPKPYQMEGIIQFNLFF